MTMYCPNCRDEFRDGFTRCHDCDVTLVENLPAEPPEPVAEMEPASDSGLVTVGRYFSPLEAHAHRMELEQAGLQAWVSDESMGATYGFAIGAGLRVRARDEEAALAILEPKPETHAEAAPVTATEEPSTDEPGRPRGHDMLELAGVLMITAGYPIVSNLIDRRPDGVTAPEHLAASACWFAGLAIVMWALLRNRTGPLSPVPLPNSKGAWVREIFTGVMLYLGLWILNRIVGALLRQAGLRDDTSSWGAFFRQAGMVPAYSLVSIFSAAYEELAFRAYLISRLAGRRGLRGAWSVIVAGALFALTHGYGAGATLMVFLDGIAYGSVYLGSRSLPRLVVAHYLFNLTVMRQYL